MSVNNGSRSSLPLCIVLCLTAMAATFAAAPSNSHVDPTSYGMTSGRLMASSSALLALIGVIIGVLALLRPNGLFGTAKGRLGAIVALVGGLVGTILGGWVAATASGIGTGGGLAGAVAALVLGLISLALGVTALSRSRRGQTQSTS